jgi:hypothetical protein
MTCPSASGNLLLLIFCIHDDGSMSYPRALWYNPTLGALNVTFHGTDCEDDAYETVYLEQSTSF